jgi:hypothetical protein
MGTDKESELSAMKKFAEKFLLFGSKVLATEIKHDKSDHFAFMTVSFCWRQIESLKSLYVLANNNCIQDMQLVSRSMLEGLALLMWVNTDTKVALKWRAFSVIIDYRLAVKKLDSKSNIDKSNINDL